MSTPHSDVENREAAVAVEPAPGDLSDPRDPREWHRQAFGLILGLALAALVYFIFPSDAPETVLQSAGADPEVDYSHQAMRIVAASGMASVIHQAPMRTVVAATMRIAWWE